MQADQFDLAQVDAGFLDNPYPTLHALRAAAPVHRNPDGSVFLTGHADCLQVYRSPAMLSDKTDEFARQFGDCPLRDHHTTSLVFNDPPYHTIVRKLIAAAFTPRKLAELEGLITQIVARSLDHVAQMGRFDLVNDFAKTLPTDLISFMLGVPEAYRASLRGYSLAILGALDPRVPADRLAAGNKAVTDFGALLGDLIDHRRRNPNSAGQGDVLDALIFGEIDGRRLTRDELIHNCIFLLNAGHETTTSLIANTVGLLLDNPDQLQKLRRDPSLIDGAVEESLRMESPLQIGNRRTGQEVTLGDTVLPIGTYIHTSIAGANRDPAVFDAPDRFDIARRPNRHIAFIAGIHVCLGASLARLEGRIAMGAFVQRFPNLSADGPAERLGLARFRGFKSMPVHV